MIYKFVKLYVLFFLKVKRRPKQLIMEDSSKLYIATAGPIIGGGFEV